MQHIGVVAMAVPCQSGDTGSSSGVINAVVLQPKGRQEGAHHAQRV
jgi:hypothetical protein